MKRKKFLGMLCGVTAVASAALFSMGAGFANNQNRSETTFGPSMLRGGHFIQEFTVHTHWHTQEIDRHIVSLSGANPIGMPNNGANYTCGIIAGSNIIKGYNKIFPGLIPGFNSVATVLGRPGWANGMSPTFRNFQSDLAIAMGGNPQGVTLNQYFNGINTMVQNRGRTFHNQTMMNGNQLNLQNLKSQLRQNRYATVFMTGFNVASISGNPGVDRFDLREYGGNHIMAVFGYRTITYRDASGAIIRVKNFLEVVTGFGGTGLLYLNNHLTIYDLHMTFIS